MNKIVLFAIFASACGTDVPLEVDLAPDRAPEEPGEDHPDPSIGPFGWARALAGPDSSQVSAVVWIDAGTDIVVGGNAASSDGELVVDLGSGPITVAQPGMGYVGRYSAEDGSPVWLRPLLAHSPEARPDAFSGVGALAAAPGDGVVAVGAFRGTIDFGGATPIQSPACEDGFVALYDADGALTTAWAVPQITLDGVVALEDGGVVVAGRETIVDCTIEAPSDADISYEHVILRFGSDGELAWKRRLQVSVDLDPEVDYAPPPGAHVSDLSVEPDGTIVVGGTFDGSLDLAGLHLETEEPLVDQPFVAALSADGAGLWARTFRSVGEASLSSIAGIALGAGGHILAAGSFGGTMDFGGGPVDSGWPNNWRSLSAFLVELDADGEFVGVAILGGREGIVRPWTLSVGSDGGVLLAGASDGSLDFGGGIGAVGPMAARFDASLGLRAIQGLSVEGLGDGTAWDIAGGPDGQTAIVGMFGGTADFGAGPIDSGAGEIGFETDGFIAVYGAPAIVD